MAVSKRLRYEVLRRDNHACRYCGASAPGAKLTIDHVVPCTLGGLDEPGNLVTACQDCNAGKSSSNPDAPIVADVSADALRWGRAMRDAAEFLGHEYRQRVDLRQRFLDAWNSWTYGFRREQFPLPGAWRESVDSLLAAGLTVEILCECVEIAMSRKNIDDRFRYMCGIAWRKVTELREIAAALLEADGAPE